MSSKRNLKKPRIPVIDDPEWEVLSQPVLEFLQEPRNWKALKAWSQASSYHSTKMRHAIAWLEQQGTITSFVKRELSAKGHLRPKIYWVSCAWMQANPIETHSSEAS